MWITAGGSGTFNAESELSHSLVPEFGITLFGTYDGSNIKDIR